MVNFLSDSCFLLPEFYSFFFFFFFFASSFCLTFFFFNENFFRAYLSYFIVFSFYLLYLISDCFFYSVFFSKVILSGSLDISEYILFSKFILVILLLVFLVTKICYYDFGHLSNKEEFIGEKFLFIEFEFFLLLLLVLISSLFIVSSSNCLSFYLSLELQSLVFYTLVGLNRNSLLSLEASVKYIIVGILASGFLLFGLSLLYFSTSILDFHSFNELRRVMPWKSFACCYSDTLSFIIFGTLLIFFGFFFKLSIFPFHLWTPNVYDGSPTLVMILISLIGKYPILFFMAKFSILMGIRAYKFIPPAFFTVNLSSSIFLVALITIFIGSIGGIIQTRIKRMWGYSALVNFGFILIGFSIFNVLGFSVSLSYLIVYTLISIPFLLSLSLTKYRADKFWAEFQHIIQWSNIRFNNVTVYLSLCLLLVSFLSIPPFPNFIIKYYTIYIIYRAFSRFGFIDLFIIFLLSLISSFYYLRLYRLITAEFNYYNRFNSIIFFYSVGLLKQFVLIVFLIFIFVYTVFYSYDLFYYIFFMLRNF